VAGANHKGCIGVAACSLCRLGNFSATAATFLSCVVLCVQHTASQLQIHTVIDACDICQWTRWPPPQYHPSKMHSLPNGCVLSQPPRIPVPRKGRNKNFKWCFLHLWPGSEVPKKACLINSSKNYRRPGAG
jgi:hypothetical protein